tara:strand:- start:945 stop:1076 length:132 start_codon:yes stop_codon:yes gene_type:complete
LPPEFPRELEELEPPQPMIKALLRMLKIIRRVFIIVTGSLDAK